MGGQMQLKTSRSLAASLAAVALATSFAAKADIVNNGGFETGDFTGWAQFGDTSFSGVDGADPHDGTYAAFFGPSGIGGITQDIPTLPGRFYTIDFWLQSESDFNGAATPNSFEFDWGGIQEFVLTNAPATAYTHYTFNLKATSPTTQLKFAFTNVPAFWDFDSVSARIPEPGSLALFGLAGALLLFALRRREVPAGVQSGSAI